MWNLAKKYNLYDVGLRIVCKRLKIPGSGQRVLGDEAI
jgi:hypothetical protein